MEINGDNNIPQFFVKDISGTTRVIIGDDILFDEQISSFLRKYMPWWTLETTQWTCCCKKIYYGKTIREQNIESLSTIYMSTTLRGD